MPDPGKPSPLDNLGKRIATARQAHTRRNEPKSSLASSSGLGLGVRIVTEIVSALAVGVVVGLLLDRWLGTAPWLLIGFFILGAAAAMRNLIRVARDAEARDKEERAQQTRDDEANE